MKIYTITLNPAYDIHAYAQDFVPFHENLAVMRSKEAGGKGLNISRALKNAGVEATAVIVLGKENSADYKTQLASTGITCLLFEEEGRIRENLTIHCDNAPETRISFAGFTLDATILRWIMESMTVDADTIVTFTGRVADGIDMDAVKAFLKDLKAKGARIVLDSRSFSLEDLYEVEPWLIKPNQEEISAFFGCAVETVDDAVAKAKEIAAHGVENAMISLGGEGAVLVSGEACLLAKAPAISVCSTIGAGDSSIAGFLTAASRGEELAACLRTAVAFGSAACMTEGSQPPSSHDVAQILEKVSVTQL